MSSHQVTIAEFIDILKKYRQDMLVAVPCPYIGPGEYFEGMFDGPNELQVVRMQDVRSGFNPTELVGQYDFEVLVIR